MKIIEKNYEETIVSISLIKRQEDKNCKLKRQRTLRHLSINAIAFDCHREDKFSIVPLVP